MREAEVGVMNYKPRADVHHQKVGRGWGTPWLQTHSFQNWEKTNLCCSKPSQASCLWYFIIADL